MNRRRRRRRLIARAAVRLAMLMLSGCSFGRVHAQAGPSAPLVIGQTFELDSRGLKETRRINVYVPAACEGSGATHCGVIYMPDGGLSEDFLHIAGLTEVLVGNGTMRPMIVVGIENTERRRDMTGPTDVERDKRIAPHVGGSGAFRNFIRDELFPEIRKRYPTNKETAIVGESLAGLFVVETLLLEPQMFDTYIAIDPSLWWNDRRLLARAGALLDRRGADPKTLYLASSNEPELVEVTRRFAQIVAGRKAGSIDGHYAPMPQETHGTIYHPAALDAFRRVLAPAAPASAAHASPGAAR